MPLVSDPLPDGPSLLAQERQSRHQGSGLGGDVLLGRWRVERVWGKGGSHPTPGAGAALRALKATLAIASGKEQGLLLTNSIRLGPFSLCFLGPGELKGRRPLLMFHFRELRFCLGDRTLVSRPLPAPAAGKEPFFALIASGQGATGSRWLAARGRGGGLALWLEDDDSPPATP
ncbi:MAG: hypothetical protein VKP70_08655 [Cyanobacteriota bacterium]|nr:hypothetical protein [Cyanobacteriota bacterium]